MHSSLQRCMCEVQQLSQKVGEPGSAEPGSAEPGSAEPGSAEPLSCVSQLQQEVEQKAAATSQLSVLSQTLRDTQTRCQWLEGQLQGHSQVKVRVPADLLLVPSLLLL